MNRMFYLTHSPIDFHFAQNTKDFVVTEVPLYEYTNEGEHLILKIRKKNLTTWEMIQAFSERVGVSFRDIGYAGLKDKNGMTVQHISINKKFADKIETFSHENIKILETFVHKNKIKIGHLKGNKFFIRLKKVNELNAKKIDEVLKSIKEFGMPNYFGYQRFGRDQNNFEKGKKIVEGIEKAKTRKEKKFLIESYQSHLFNLWLSKRVELSKLVDSLSEDELVEYLNFSIDVVRELKKQKNKLKILEGDLASHYPFGKIFQIENIEEESSRFFNKEIVPTGILSGKKVLHSNGFAWTYEKDFIDDNIQLDGFRRFAWIFPTEIESVYKSSENWYELSFFLPKGSYATILLEEIKHSQLIE